MGWHSCELCRVAPARGVYNVWIPSDAALYVAPELVVHYIEAHQYRPPDEFIAAVLACPEQGTAEYLRLVGQHSRHQPV
jgi:hypothetical protein